MMERCNTCKHWDKIQEDTFYAIPGTGGCTAARQIWDVAKLSEPDYDHLELQPEHAGLKCFVMDGSQYMAELITMGDFGCVMHEAKTD